MNTCTNEEKKVTIRLQIYIVGVETRLINKKKTWGIISWNSTVHIHTHTHIHKFYLMRFIVCLDFIICYLSFWQFMHRSPLPLRRKTALFAQREQQAKQKGS